MITYILHTNDNSLYANCVHIAYFRADIIPYVCILMITYILHTNDNSLDANCVHINFCTRLNTVLWQCEFSMIIVS